MSIQSRLLESVDKSIDRICPNSFHDFSQNHCAHFVSHVADLDFSFNCREFKGGSGQPANVRVHEIFANCPLVGNWADAPTANGKPLLIFVTRRNNVRISDKFMGNIPQKHVGIYADGHVFHYSNTQNQVVKWSVDKFFSTFRQIYSGEQGLFFGIIPGIDLDLNVRLVPDKSVSGKKFLLKKSGRDWSASADGGEEFYVGRETSNGGYVGLFVPADKQSGPVYRAADYEDRIDHWARLLELTGYCESKNRFNMINTYDNAKFTFGFYQLAAHTANDNLILLFRRMFNLPEASAYFPELALINGRVHRIGKDGGATDLEVEMATGPNNRRQLQLFMNYLNARFNEHDEQEVLQSARVIHWSNHSAAFRDLQVEVSNSILQRKMNTYSNWYNLDGKSDVLCALVADIHHQGRARRTAVTEALQAPDPMERLIEINPVYTGRIRDLREKLTRMREAGQLGVKTYSASVGEFQ